MGLFFKFFPADTGYSDEPEAQEKHGSRFRNRSADDQLILNPYAQIDNLNLAIVHPAITTCISITLAPIINKSISSK